jgi:hypothetical protein
VQADLPVPGQVHPVPAVAQQPAQHLAQLGVVLDDENPRRLVQGLVTHRSIILTVPRCVIRRLVVAAAWLLILRRGVVSALLGAGALGLVVALVGLA